MVAMIDRDTLAKIAKNSGLKPYQQEKHYVQALALLALSDYPLVFKGGTYLWFFHGLGRFSEDLDFTASGELPEGLESKVSESLGLYGIENKVRIEAKDERSYSFRISAKGPLNTSEIDLCHLYVEISKRESVMKKPLPLRLDFPYQTPTKTISGMDLAEVAAEKTRAIMTRDKARDAYDLFYLVNKGVEIDLDLVNEKLKYYKIGFSKEKFAKQVSRIRKDWERELGPLVFEKLPGFDEVEKRLGTLF